VSLQLTGGGSIRYRPPLDHRIFSIRTRAWRPQLNLGVDAYTVTFTIMFRRSPQSPLRRIAAAIIAFPILVFGACYGHSALWERGAEHAIATTIAATAQGRAPDAIQASVRGDSALIPAVDCRLPYELRGVDNFPAGSGLLDLLSPGILVAHARFANGHVYHVEARRVWGRWQVTLEPAEAQSG
jgi:hypothetical protein